MKYLNLLVLALFFNAYSFAQTKSSDIVIGKNYTIESTALSQQREIQIYLPNCYA